ncbi:hypothetical protein, partial [Devosia submarina]|uniref:hypothetical protein n=1 Tax=Devosia submarina TaxID=1173082 RepID=UPI001AECF562
FGSWVEGAKRELLNQAILNQAVATGALPLSHRAHPPAQRVSSPAPTLPFKAAILKDRYGVDSRPSALKLLCAKS